MSPSPAHPTSPSQAQFGAAPKTVDAQQGWPGDHYELLGRIIRNFEESEMATVDARAEAERSRDFVSGIHWTSEEIAELRRRRQPVVWNNIIGRKVELLRGIERKGRSDPEAYPRTPNENTRADAATQALRYLADENRFDVIRSSAYDNLLVEGFCGAEVIVQEQSDGDGYDVVINHIPWERLYYDPHSQHPAFTDCSFLGVVIWMDREDALDMYPGSEDILDTTIDAGRSDTYDDKPRTIWADAKRRRVRVIQHHWKRRNAWWVATLTKGGFLEQPLQSPYLDRHGNPTCPVILRSAKVDRDNNRFGIVRDLVPLQESINKRESKLLHALSVNQIIMEEGAVADIDQARREAAKPDGLIVKNRGFEFEIHKDQAEIEGQFQLLQYSVAQMQLMGPNSALGGKDPRDQSGRAILAQQAGGQVENEPMADALRQWTHKVWESCWCRVRQFWTGPRWIRVTDSDKNTQFVGLNHPITIAEMLSNLDQTVPLQQQLQGLSPQDRQAVQIGMKLPPGDPRLQTVVRVENDIGDLDVSITLEEGPDNPTMEAEQFQQIMQLPPQILMQFPPEFIIKASSLRNKAELIKMLEDHAQAQQQSGQATQANQAALQAAQVAKVQADAKDKNAQALERLHGMATDHAAVPGQNALLDAQTAGARANALGTYHGMAMDHAAATVPAPTDQPAAPPPPDPLAVQDQAHSQAMDRANLGLAADAQAHNQAMDLAAHGLAVKQANQPPPAQGPSP
jgi:hypothetical protein